MKLFRQIAAVTAMNLRSLPQRAATSLVIVIGIAGVVAVLTSVLAMSTGMIKTMNNSGRDDRVIVLRNGSTNETSSAINRESLRLIMDVPGVKRDDAGKPILSGEALRLISLHKKEDGSQVNVVLRGVGPQLPELRPEVRIVEGRMFNPAVNEVIVGKSAAAQYSGVKLGDHVSSRRTTWTVVGIFESGGDSHQSEVMADAETLITSDGRGSFQNVTVMLDSPASFQKFKDALTSNPALSLDVWKERDYYEQASKGISRVISFLAYIVGGIMAVGAVFGALNTMYSAVSERLREIATLRAMGFGAAAMVVSVLAEALLLAAIGGAIGAAIAWAFFNGNTVSTGGTAMGQLIFDLTVSPRLMLVGIVWAAAIGLIGGLFPAIRAARLPVATALRAI
jgi:putative ABC transport system permease protein